jgi:hypothetical protein
VFPSLFVSCKFLGAAVTDTYEFSADSSVQLMQLHEWRRGRARPNQDAKVQAGVFKDEGKARFYAHHDKVNRDNASLPQGETENKVIAFAEEHKGEIEVTVVKPGFITAPWNIGKFIIATALSWMVSLPNISVGQISTAMLDQVVNGFEKDPLLPEDLVRIAGNTMYKE